MPRNIDLLRRTKERLAGFGAVQKVRDHEKRLRRTERADAGGTSVTNITNLSSSGVVSSNTGFRFVATSLVIASGSITITGDAHWIDTEASAASDDLDTIVGGDTDRLLYLSAAHDARTVVIKHSTGNILCVGNADITLDDAHDFAVLWYDSLLSKWKALMGSAGGGGGAVATDAIWDAKGDLAAGTGANTASRLAVGADDAILMAASGEATGLKWAAPATTTELANPALTEAAGTSDTYARGDHVHGFAGFVWMPIAEWFIGGPMRADASNHLGKVVKLPDYATACAALALSLNLVTAPTGSAANFDIKSSTTFGGALTSLFSTTPTVSASANEDSAAVFNPTTIDGVKYLRLYCTQKGSTEPGRDLTVQVWAKVSVEF